MEMLALLLVFPLVWPLVAKLIWKHEITPKELGLNVAIVVLVVIAGWCGGRYSQSHDREVWNGKLTSKSSDRVRCSHSYECNCTFSTNSKGKREKSCSTCYEHRYDVDWNLHTTVGDIEVDRVDRQGVKEPERYSRAAIGDPVAQAKSFTNYVKGAPDSLFSALAERQAAEKYRSVVPEYPLNIYDYHYLNRVLAVGVTIPDLPDWNREVALRLRELGPAKQVNWVVVLANQADPSYADALRVAWLGGKKNDVVVVLGVPEYPKIAWTRVLSWTDQGIFKVQLRDELQDLKTIERTAVLDVIEKHVKASFVRKHMKDFEYLANEVQPPAWLIALLAIGSLIGSVALSLHFAKNGVSSGGGYARYRRRFSR